MEGAPALCSAPRWLLPQRPPPSGPPSSSFMLLFLSAPSWTECLANKVVTSLCPFHSCHTQGLRPKGPRRNRGKPMCFLNPGRWPPETCRADKALLSCLAGRALTLGSDVQK